MSRADPTYNRVSSKFWSDAKDEGWSDDMVTLALYLLTCPQRTTEGLFRLPKGYMVEDLPDGWNSERLSHSLTRLIAKGFVEYDDKARVVFLPHAMKYQRPDNRQQQVHAIRNVKSLPPTHLWSRFLEAAKTYCPAFHEALLEALPKGYGEGYGEGYGQDYGIPPAPAPAPALKALNPPNPPLADADAPAGANGDGPVSDSATNTTPLDDDFSEWWAAYGRIGSKADAERLYRFWRDKGAERADLLRAATVYRDHCRRDRSRMQHARTFLAKPPKGGRARWYEWAAGEDHGPMDPGTLATTSLGMDRADFDDDFYTGGEA